MSLDVNKQVSFYENKFDNFIDSLLRFIEENVLCTNYYSMNCECCKYRKFSFQLESNCYFDLYFTEEEQYLYQINAGKVCSKCLKNYQLNQCCDHL